MKYINHIKLNFKDCSELIFMNNDCEIIVNNLKKSYVMSVGISDVYYSYDSLELYFTAKSGTDHNFDSLKKVKDDKLYNLASIRIYYTDGSDLLLHVTDNRKIINIDDKDDFFHVLYL